MLFVSSLHRVAALAGVKFPEYTVPGDTPPEEIAFIGKLTDGVLFVIDGTFTPTPCKEVPRFIDAILTHDDCGTPSRRRA